MCPFDTATRPIARRQSDRNSAGSVPKSPHATPDGSPCPSYPHCTSGQVYKTPNLRELHPFNDIQM